MNADTNLQVWLETQAHSRPPVIVPYVQSSHHANLRYLLRTIVSHNGGSSRVSQGGALEVPADTPVALPRLTISPVNGECRIELVLSGKQGADQHYEFDCSSAPPIMDHTEMKHLHPN